MKIAPKSLETICQALAGVCPPERLRIDTIDRFAGVTPEASVAAIVARIRSDGTSHPSSWLQERLQAAFPEYFRSPAKPRKTTTTAAVVAAVVAQFAMDILQARLGIELACGSRRVSETEAIVWFEYFLDGIGAQAFTCAVIGVGAVLGEADNPAESVASYVNGLDKLIGRRAPNIDAQILIAAARRRDIPVLQIGDNHTLWQFGWGARSERFWVTTSNSDGVVGFRILGDKDLSKKMFRELGFPTPAWTVLGPTDDLKQAAKEIGWPCAVKPLSGGGGRAVNAGIRDFNALERAVSLARNAESRIMIEAHVPGEDYRLMVVDGQLICAINRRKPQIQGDGRRTVRELIDALNASRQGSKRESGFLVPVKNDDALAFNLARQGLTLESILAKDQTAYLRSNANLSSGGTAVDVTDTVHPQVRGMAIHLAAGLGQRAIGIDYLTRDITRSHDEAGGGFIEANATPALDVLIAGGNDEDRMAGILLGDRPGRIPASLLLCDGGRIADITSAIETRLQEGIAAASSSWARIGSLAMPAGFFGALGPVNAVLRNPNVHRLAVIWSHDELIELGLPLDSFESIVGFGELPPSPWPALLRKRSQRLLTASTAEEAVALSLDTAAQA